MKKWLTDILADALIRARPPIPWPIPSWKDGPIKLTDEQFASLVAHLNAPDLVQAKLVRKVDAIEAHLNRLDESASSAWRDLEGRVAKIEAGGCQGPV